MKRLAIILGLIVSMGFVFLPCSTFALSYSNENGYDVAETKKPLPELHLMSEEDFSDMFDSTQAITNRYFPMTNTTSTRIFESDDGEERFELTNIGPGRVIMGVQTTTQLDRSFEGGLLVEETYDYYAQDKIGHVWYMGEDVTNYEYDEDGNLLGTTNESAWIAENGENLPGWMMIANPSMADIDLSYYQEVAPNEDALDEGTIWGFIDQVVLGNGEAFDDVLQVLEYAPSFEEDEEGAWEYKYYASGFGLIKVDEGLVRIGNDYVQGVDGMTIEYVDTVAAAPVPEPSTVVLLGVGLIGIAGLGRKKLKK
jgi:hypothetical protein